MNDKELNLKVAEKLGWIMLEGETAILEFQGTASVVPEAQHTRRIWTQGDSFMACEECGTFPDFINEPPWTLWLLEIICKTCSHLVLESWVDGYRTTMHQLSTQPIGALGDSIGRSICRAFVSQ